jgi:hypothetical protein
MSASPTMLPYVADAGSTSTTPIASGRSRAGFSSATYASFSAGASMA